MTEQTIVSSMHIPEMSLVPNPLEPMAYVAIRDGVGKALVELGSENADLWVLTADVKESTRVHWFAEKFPRRFVQVGIAEQNLAGVAAGIAACGKTVFMSAFAAFSPGRNWDQIRVSLCYSNFNVKIYASHAGITVGPDGATHQALEDINMLRALPNMMIVVPCDAVQAHKATRALAERYGPAYIRTTREKVAVFTTPDTPFEPGKANVYREGSDVALFACGVEVYESLRAAEDLQKEGISCAVVDCHTIKPIDRTAILEWARKTGLIVSVEEHQINGGLGSAIAEVLTEEGAGTVLKRHGVYDTFCESGGARELMQKYKLDAAGIAEVVREAFQRGKR